MISMTYSEYLDKVYGCWLGKCISGTIGAPYEGMKELMDLKYDPSVLENMLPNDDLDLQVLWLEVLEQKGTAFTAEDLAKAFLEKCPYAPGEYAVFKKNFNRGIHPPMTGAFNNHYYREGMGCPIRSEIWACVAPGDPALAARLCVHDGVLDHEGNSVYTEQFFAALQAAAFVEKDLDTLVEIGLQFVPKDARIYRLITDTVTWCKESSDWRYVRNKVIRYYGHPDCTNLFQNIGIILLALYFGKMNLIETTMIALNCGFDTDCTCATAGALIGIIQGAESLFKHYNFSEQSYILGVQANRRSDKVFDLAEDTCRVGIHFTRKLNTKLEITDALEVFIQEPEMPEVEMEVCYENNTPAVGLGESRGVKLWITNRSCRDIHGRLKLHIPEGWKVDVPQCCVNLETGTSLPISLTFSVPHDLPLLKENNIIRAELVTDDDRKFTYDFGIVGAMVWKVYGPFWENNVEMPPLAPKESYYKYIVGENEQDTIDKIRTYHVNCITKPEKEYMTLEEIYDDSRAKGVDAYKEGTLVNLYEDKFSVDQLVGFQGPCVVYMVRYLYSPEDRKVGASIGHSDAFELYINDQLAAKKDHVEWWTSENVHLLGVELKKGLNRIVLKLARRNGRADFNLTFVHGGACSEYYHDFGSYHPEKI